MAGPNDFTGQNIQDTYQRVLQISSSGQITDGTGSLVSISANTATTASYALFAVSASHEITFELSSSHAISANTASFATNFTASGNISASGNITADNILANAGINSNGNIVVQQPGQNNFVLINKLGHITASGHISASGTIDANRIDIQNKRIVYTDPNIEFKDTGLEIGGNVTASGDISASGNVIANNFIGTINGGKF